MLQVGDVLQGNSVPVTCHPLKTDPAAAMATSVGPVPSGPCREHVPGQLIAFDPTDCTVPVPVPARVTVTV
jgi:hypothetical protein